jgi:hypothetical protein
MTATSLRTATSADLDFLWRLVVVTMKDYVRDTFGWDEEFQRERFGRTFHPDKIEMLFA